MAITIIKQQTSNTFHPVNNQIGITVNSTNSGKCNFRYVCDIYINNIFVFRDKLFPDPGTGYGFFKLNSIISDYITNLVPKVPEPGYFNSASLTTAPSGVVSVRFKIGEEYDTSVDCSGNVIQYLNLTQTNTFYSFNAAIDYQDFPSFDYTKYLGVWASASNDMLFLTNSPREVEVSYNEPYYLDFISLTPPPTYSGPTAGYVALEISLMTKYGTSTITEPMTTLNDSKRFRLSVGPYDLNRLTSTSIISDYVNSYTIRLVWQTSDGINPPVVHMGLTELFTFKVRRPKDFSTRFGFINRLGGIDQFTFYHRNTKSYNIERKTFRKLLQSNYSGDWSYEVGDRSDSTYNIYAKEIHSVGTFCRREDSEWLDEMWMSPDSWVYDIPTTTPFHTEINGNSLDIWMEKDHDVKAGDYIFVLAVYKPSAPVFNKMLVDSVQGRRLVVSSFTYDPSVSESYCGWIQKEKDFVRLPIMITDNIKETKQKLTRPIEYTLNYMAAYDKTTVK